MKGPQNREKGTNEDEKASSLSRAIDMNLDVKGHASAVLRIEERALKQIKN